MPKTIGIDVSKDFLDVASFDGDTFIHQRIEGNDKRTFQRLTKTFSIDKDTLIAMEATGIYHLKLAHYLLEKGYQVCVINPLIIKNYGKTLMTRAETDKAAAKLLSRYAKEYQPPLYQPRCAQREELILTLKALEDLQGTRLDYVNRLHTLRKRPQSSTTIQKSLKTLMNTLDKQIKLLTKALEKLAQEFAPNDYKRLKAIDGVGPMISAMIIGYYGDFSDFASANQAIAFAGTNPHPRVSGKSTYKQASISKKGHPYLRKMLYMGARSARKYNPTCRALYERLRENGKSHKLAMVAVANKLLRQIYAVVKYQREYDPDFHQKFLIQT